LHNVIHKRRPEYRRLALTSLMYSFLSKNVGIWHLLVLVMHVYSHKCKGLKDHMMEFHIFLLMVYFLAIINNIDQ